MEMNRAKQVCTCGLFFPFVYTHAHTRRIVDARKHAETCGPFMASWCRSWDSFSKPGRWAAMIGGVTACNIGQHFVFFSLGLFCVIPGMNGHEKHEFGGWGG